MVWRVELEFDERASCHTPSNHFTTSILSNSLFPAWILPTRINNFTCIDWNSSTTIEGFKKKKKFLTKNLGYLIYLKKEETTSETRTKEKKKEKSWISGSKVENSNERSRRKFVRFLEWNPLSAALHLRQRRQGLALFKAINDSIGIRLIEPL